MAKDSLWNRMCQKGDFKDMSCLGKLIVVRLPELGSVDAMALAFRGTWVRGVWPVGKSTGLRFLCRKPLSYPLIPTFMLIYSHTCSRTHTHIHTLPDTLNCFCKCEPDLPVSRMCNGCTETAAELLLDIQQCRKNFRVFKCGPQNELSSII